MMIVPPTHSDVVDCVTQLLNEVIVIRQSVQIVDGQQRAAANSLAEFANDYRDRWPLTTRGGNPGGEVFGAIGSAMGSANGAPGRGPDASFRSRSVRGVPRSKAAHTRERRSDVRSVAVQQGGDGRGDESIFRTGDKGRQRHARRVTGAGRGCDDDGSAGQRDLGDVVDHVGSVRKLAAQEGGKTGPVVGFMLRLVLNWSECDQPTGTGREIAGRNSQARILPDSRRSGSRTGRNSAVFSLAASRCNNVRMRRTASSTSSAVVVAPKLNRKRSRLSAGSQAHRDQHRRGFARAAGTCGAGRTGDAGLVESDE